MVLTKEQKKTQQALRRKAYLEAKAKREQDPEFLAKKEAYKQEQKKRYQEQKAKQQALNKALKEKKKQKHNQDYQARLKQKMAAVQELMKKGSDIEPPNHQDDESL